MGTAVGDYVRVTAGFAGHWETGRETGAQLTGADQTCMDKCERFHSLFATPADVSGLVNEHGLLLVSVASSAIVDFCGDGDLLRAESTLSW